MAALACASAALAGPGCGGGSGGEPESDGDPSQLELPAARDARGAKGRQLVARTGCLACHRIGGSGHEGPGQDLSSIGDSRDAREIARALVDSPRPMPSYDGLAAEDRGAIVAYLASLRTP